MSVVSHYYLYSGSCSLNIIEIITKPLDLQRQKSVIEVLLDLMLAIKGSPVNFHMKKHKEDTTPISTAPQLQIGSELKLPASVVVKPLWIGKLVSKYLKKMESEECKHQSNKKKRRHKSSHRLAETQKNTFKHIHLTPKIHQTGRKPRPNTKIRDGFHAENNSPKKKNASRSVRKRVQTAVSERAGYPSIGKDHQKTSGDVTYSTS